MVPTSSFIPGSSSGQALRRDAGEESGGGFEGLETIWKQIRFFERLEPKSCANKGCNVFIITEKRDVWACE
jgi:hypothetical protein